MSERDRGLEIPPPDETLRIQPVNGGWVIWRGGEPEYLAPDPIAVTSVADLTEIIARWAVPEIQQAHKGAAVGREGFSEATTGGLLP